jgi:hypothetical protein
VLMYVKFLKAVRKLRPLHPGHFATDICFRLLLLLLLLLFSFVLPYWVISLLFFLNYNSMLVKSPCRVSTSVCVCVCVCVCVGVCVCV